MIAIPPWRTTARAAAVAAAVAALLLAPLPTLWRTSWYSKALDVGHLPLFAAMTVGLGRWGGLGVRNAWLAASAFAGAGEVAQAFVGRSGNVDDFARGVIGASLGVVAERLARGPRSARSWGAGAVATAALLAWPAADAYPILRDAADGYRSFPVLADFSTPKQAWRWGLTQARLAIDPGAGSITFLPGRRPYSAALFRPVVCDWTGYAKLTIEVDAATPVPDFNVTVHDTRRERGYGHRFNREWPLSAGANRLDIPLPEIQAGAAKRPLDLREVQAVQFFVPPPRRETVVTVRSLRLER